MKNHFADTDKAIYLKEHMNAHLEEIAKLEENIEQKRKCIRRLEAEYRYNEQLYLIDNNIEEEDAPKTDAPKQKNRGGRKVGTHPITLSEQKAFDKFIEDTFIVDDPIQYIDAYELYAAEESLPTRCRDSFSSLCKMTGRIELSGPNNNRIFKRVK